MVNDTVLPEAASLSVLTGTMTSGSVFKDAFMFDLCKVENARISNARSGKLYFRSCMVSNLALDESHFGKLEAEETRIYNLHIPGSRKNRQVDLLSIVNSLVVDSDVFAKDVCARSCEVAGGSFFAKKIEAELSRLYDCAIEAPIVRFEHCVLYCTVKAAKIVISDCVGKLNVAGNPEIVFSPRYHGIEILNADGAAKGD